MRACFARCLSSIRLGGSVFLENSKRILSSLETPALPNSSYSVVTDVDKSKATVINEFRIKNNGVLSYENYIDIKMLFISDLGLSPTTVAGLASDCKEIYSFHTDEIKSWIDSLVFRSFHRTQVAELLQHNPWLLLIPVENILNILDKIMVTYEISTKELPVFCVNAPCILADTKTAEKTTDKYNYFHFIMCYRNVGDIVTSGAFKFPLDYLKLRYEFLYRRGQFYPMNRHFQTRVKLPSLKDVFCTTDHDFCETVAKCDLNELLLFKKLFAVEEELRDEEERAEMNEVASAKNDVEDFDDFENELDDLDMNSFANELTKHL